MCCIRNKEKSNLQLLEKNTDFFTVIDSQVDTQMDTVKNIQWEHWKSLEKEEKYRREARGEKKYEEVWRAREREEVMNKFVPFISD